MTLSHTKRADDYKYNIAAVLYNPETGKILAKAKNDIPTCFHSIIDHDIELGDSGSTIHAEISVLSMSPVPTQGMALVVTDPLCPNCMKMIISAGISRILVYEKGLTKGYWYNSNDEVDVPRKKYFDDVSLVFAKQAGVEVLVVNEAGELVNFLLPKKQVEWQTQTIMRRVADHKILEDYTDAIKKQPHAITVVEDQDGVAHVVITVEEYTKGMNADIEASIRSKFDVLRYRLKLDALSHMLSFCAAKNLRLRNSPVYISEIPTSRCIVNAVGAGVGSFGLATMDAQSEKSKNALLALDTLKKHGLIKAAQISKIQQFLDI